MHSKLAGMALVIAAVVGGGNRAWADVVHDWNIEALRVTFQCRAAEPGPGLRRP